MLILSSQDLFFSALRKQALHDAHLLFPRPAGKPNKTKLLLLIPNTPLAPRRLVLGLLDAALTNRSANEPAENTRPNLLSAGWLSTCGSISTQWEGRTDLRVSVAGRSAGAAAAAAAPAQPPRSHGGTLPAEPALPPRRPHAGQAGR